MGRGNFFFSNHTDNYTTYYANVHPDWDESKSESENMDDSRMAWDDFVSNIQYIKGLNKTEDWLPGRDQGMVIAENGVLQVCVNDNEHNIAIACIPKKDEYDRIVPSFKRSATRIMREIGGMYELRHYGGPWTGGAKVENPQSYQYY
jgi:hypothetical protein